MGVDAAGINLLPETSRRALLLELLEQAGAVAVRVNDSTGEIIHGCLLTPEQHSNQHSSPTASISYRTLAANCLGCRAKGGLIWFVATVLHLDDGGARTWLAGHGLTEDGTMALPAVLGAISEAYGARDTPAVTEPIPAYSLTALEAFKHPSAYWTDPQAPPGTSGGGRGIHPDTVAARRLGYDPASKRVVIPHFWRGDLVGWQKRPAGPVPKDTPKYQNTPSFPRKSTLYHLREDAEEILLVESAMSVLKHAHAMNDITASFGAWLTDEQISAIIRLPNLRRVICWPDSDPKGWDAFDGGRNPRDGLIARLSPWTQVYYVESAFTGDPANLDTDLAAAMREQWTRPAALWKRPQNLFCWHCHRYEHNGPCSSRRAAA